MIEVTTPAQLTYDERGLIPCVVQQYDTGEVLMVAWMNEESVGLTLERGTTWFWSRSRMRTCVHRGYPSRYRRRDARRIQMRWERPHGQSVRADR